MSLTRDLARLNIDSAGTINIGTTSSFSVNNTSDGTAIDAKKNGTSQATIGVSGSAGTLVLNTNGSSGVGLFGSTNNGGCLLPTDGAAGAVDNARDLGRGDVRWRDIYLSGGAYIGGTTAANKIDDYEEGTWSGSVGAVAGATQPSVSSGTFTGSYTKIGRVVHVSFYVGPFQMSGNLSGTLAIKGMPFAHGGGDSTNGGVTSTYYVTWARPDYVALRVYSGNEAGFLSVNNGANWGWEYCTACGTGGSRYITGTLQYTVA